MPMGQTLIAMLVAMTAEVVKISMILATTTGAMTGTMSEITPIKATMVCTLLESSQATTWATTTTSLNTCTT